eukprot:Em0017g79a
MTKPVGTRSSLWRVPLLYFVCTTAAVVKTRMFPGVFPVVPTSSRGRRPSRWPMTTPTAPPSSTASHMPIDQGSLSLENICWDQLPPQKRVQVLNRLHAILKHLPSEDLLPFPSCSSLDMIPHSLANTIRKYSSIGITSASTSKNNKSPAHLTQGSSRIDIKEIKSKQRPSQSPPVEHNSPNPQGHAQKRLRHAPYGGRPSKSTPSHLSETTRCASNGSSCSDDSDVVID